MLLKKDTKELIGRLKLEMKHELRGKSTAELSDAEELDSETSVKTKRKYKFLILKV